MPSSLSKYNFCVLNCISVNADKLKHALKKLTGLMGCYSVYFGVYVGLPAFRSNLPPYVQGRRIRRWGEGTCRMGSFVALVFVFLPPFLSVRTLKMEAEGLNETSMCI